MDALISVKGVAEFLANNKPTPIAVEVSGVSNFDCRFETSIEIRLLAVTPELSPNRVTLRYVIGEINDAIYGAYRFERVAYLLESVSIFFTQLSYQEPGYIIYCVLHE